MHSAGDPRCVGLFGIAFARWSYAPTGRRERWVNERSPMVLCPKRGGGIAGSLNKARWFYAPTGRKGIAQGKAKRRPGIGFLETTQALKGRNRRRVNQCAHVSPFQGFGELGRRRTQRDGVRPRVMAYDPGWRFAPRVALRSTLGYLIMPRWGEDPVTDRF